MKESIFDVNPFNIWNFKQNHPELVVKDVKEQWTPMMEKVRAEIQTGKFEKNLCERICEVVRLSMLCRGVNKWLKVRRDLIAYKKAVKKEVIELHNTIPILKQNLTRDFVDWNKPHTEEQLITYFNTREKYLVAKELLRYKLKLRKDLKALCMTDRWQQWVDKTGKPIAVEKMNTLKS